MLRHGADEYELAALEERLGTSLPPSYRAFLLLTNGAWAQAGWGLRGLADPPADGDDEHACGFLDARRVGWFRDREASYVEIWGYTDYAGDDSDDPAHYAFRRLVPECEYLDHEREQDCIHAKAGHVRYALQVSSDVDGYTILLNPLVVDREGEWEAWDFGSKLPGAMRHRSFAALLEAEVEQLEREVLAPPPGAEEARATFADDRRPLTERAAAASLLAWHGERERVLDFLLEVLADEGAGVDARQAAAGALGGIDDPRATAALVAAAADAEPRLQASVLPPLAVSADPDARRAALRMLTAPGVEDWVIRSTWPAARETVWEAWRATGDPRLLIQLAYCGDRRACGPLSESIVDPHVPQQSRDWLIRYAWWPADPSVVPALVASTELPDTPLVPVAEALVRLGAEDDAVAVLARAIREADPFGQAAALLGSLGRPEGRAVLLEVLAHDPTPAAARALGDYTDAEVASALRGVAAAPDLRIAVLDALEKMQSPAGRDALAELAEEGDLLAAGALARQRDERALPRLLDALTDDDIAVAFEGADGLRNLRSPASLGALLAEVERMRDDDLAACAAHALVTMHAPEAEAALAALAGGSAALRRLAELWG